jgi:phage terminase small subunit
MAKKTTPTTKKTKPAKKGTKKQKPLKEKFAHISEDRPLTKREMTFALEYVKNGKKGQEAALTAGYTKSTARQHAYVLVNIKPNTRKFIAELLANYFNRLEFDAFKALEHVGRVAFGDRSEVTQIVDGRVVNTDTEKMSPAAKAMYLGAKERINERGDVTVEVKTADPAPAQKLIFQWLGLIDKARRQKQTLHPEQRKALEDVRDGLKTAEEAAVALEIEGLGLPETLRIMLAKQALGEDFGDDSEMVIPTPEEMEERHQKKLKEIEDQKKDFLPRRQEEIRNLKEALGDKNKEFSEDGEQEKS